MKGNSMGWNRSAGKSAAGAWRPQNKHWRPRLLFVVGALLGAVALGVWFLRETGADDEAKIATKELKPGRIVEVKAAKPSAPKATDEAKSAAPPAVKPETKSDTNIVWVGKRSYIQKLSNGKSVTIYVDDPSEVKPAPVFVVGLNNFLANFITPGEHIPETPMEVSDEETLAALTEKIEIKDDDSDDIRWQKEAVLALRENLRAYIKDGRTVVDFLRDVQRRQEMEAEHVRAARDMIMESLANDDPAHARELYDAINEHLNAKGLPKVRLSRRHLKLMETMK